MALLRPLPTTPLWRLPSWVAVALLGASLATPVARADETSAPLPPPPPPAAVEVLPEMSIAPPVTQRVRSAQPGAAAPALEALQPVGLLRGREVVLRRTGALGNTLGEEPGVWATSFGPGASRPVLRGQGGDRIRVLEGALGTLDVAGISDDHAVPLDPFAAEGYEVLRGPASLRFGPQAVGGVVAVQDGRIPEAALGRALAGRVGGAWGSADEERAGFARLEGQSGRWRWRASAFARATDDIDIPGFAKSARLLEEEGNPSGAGEARGTLPNSATEAEGGAVGVSRLLPGGGFVGAALSAFATDYGLPNEADVTIDLERWRVDARGRHVGPFAGWQELAWSAAFVDYEHTELEGADAGTVFDQQAFEGRLEATRCAAGCRSGSLGVQVGWHDLEVVGDEALLPFDETLDLGAFAVERWELARRLALEGSLRYDLRSIQSVGEETFHALSGSLGLLYRPYANASLALSASFTQRAPTAFELYADGPHVATEAYEVGDPDLDLEQAFGLDLTWRSTGCRLTLAASAFYERYPSYIALLPTGAVDAGSGFDVYAYEDVDAEIAGFEIDGAVHLWRRAARGLDLTFQADFVYAQDLTHDAPLPRQPPLRLGAGLLYQDARWTARVAVLHAFDQDREAPFELATDAYTLLEAGVSFGPLPGRRGPSVAVVGTNLLDDEVRLATSFIKDVAPLPGASVRIEVAFDF